MSMNTNWTCGTSITRPYEWLEYRISEAMTCLDRELTPIRIQCAFCSDESKWNWLLFTQNFAPRQLVRSHIHGNSGSLLARLYEWLEYRISEAMTCLDRELTSIRIRCTFCSDESKWNWLLFTQNFASRQLVRSHIHGNSGSLLALNGASFRN